jgi:hypothetical protein
MLARRAPSWKTGQRHDHLARRISQGQTRPPDDPLSEDQRLAKGLDRLIALLQAKLTDLQHGNAS